MHLQRIWEECQEGLVVATVVHNQIVMMDYYHVLAIHYYYPPRDYVPRGTILLVPRDGIRRDLAGARVIVPNIDGSSLRML
jgi:hypothetical protein